MSEPKIPSAEQVQKTIARSRRARQEIALAAIDLQDLILKLEELTAVSDQISHNKGLFN